jgi:hypothetical protein
VKRATRPAKRSAPPTEIDPHFAPVVKAFARARQVVCDQGWGAGNTVLKVKGKIFAMTVGGDLVVKVSRPRAAELVSGGAGTYFEPRHDGKLMKEWVVVEAGKTSWIDLAREAYGFVGGAKS